jgi:predicted permease
MGRGQIVESIWADLKYAVRQLRKAPGFAVTAVLTLALGIGANATIFSIIEAVLLRPLPYSHPERLVVVWQADQTHRSTGAWFNAYREFEAWRDNSQSFEKLAALTWATGAHTTLWHDQPIDVLAIPASVDFFSLLGVQAQFGRTFLPSDLRASCTLVLSHQFWKQKLGAPGNMVGQNLMVDRTPCQIVGVMPKNFSFYPTETSAWTLMTPAGEFAQSPWHSMTGVFGLLKPGVTRASAEAELSAIQARVLPEAPADLSVMRTMLPAVLDLQSNFTWLAGRNLRTGLWALFGAVSLILLMACVNVANLLLGRALERSREIAIRVALGSGHARLMRQLFTEALLLALCGTVAGVLLAVLLLQVFRSLNPIEMPPGSVVTLDWRVLLFSAALGIGSAVVFGLFPAWRGPRVDLNTTLKNSERSAGTSESIQRVSQSFVIIQVALSLTLLAGAGLLVESLWRLASTQLGYRTDHLLTATVNLASQRYPDVKTRSLISDRIADAVSSLPGVQGATSASDSTPHGETLLSIAGDSSPQRASAQVATQEVATNFFSFMRIPLLSGRRFDRRDQQDTQQVAIVNQALARKFFPHIDPIGQEIKLSRADDDSVPWLTVIGVIANVKTSTVFKEMGYIEEPSVYRPHAQNAPASIALIVGAEASPPELVSEIQQQLFVLDPGLLLAGVETMEARQATALSPPRFRAVLFGSFAFLALVLAVVGLYGVLSQLVSRRTGEIAIRMALGANRARILRSVLRRAFTMVVAGICLGVVGGALAVHLIRGLLYDVRPGNYAQFALASLLMLLVGLVASWLPARRASSVDPMQALRGE